MQVDLFTLYFLAIGTLFASAGMTLWEHRAHPARSKELKILAGGYATLGIGVALAIWRHALPGAWGGAISNSIIVTGYLRVAHGLAVMNGRQYRTASAVILALLALAWAVAGARGQVAMWLYFSAIPISLASAMATRELLRNDGLEWAQARSIAVIVTGVHAVLYAFRACVLPWLATRYGQAVLPLVSKITMYEGVLYSVVLPMTLLRLVRDETHSRLLQESQTDYLTRLGNRRWFFEEGARVLSRAGTRERVALLAFDLDRFKTINDRYGHQAGDAVLKTFANVARGELGPDAVLARIGGEEFAALLAGRDSDRAQMIGERIVQRFAQTAAHSVDGRGVRATVSIGLAMSDPQSRMQPGLQGGLQAHNAPAALAGLLSAADAALYDAKALGGNRLELAQRAERSQNA
ncbi:GGDEF domain-containing protein [Paraburkholderia sacchari]|uniref:GGDEF domain-containing protein n=1 Tax=Paraburkholderia sacchari TaxID=159450 RepID=UPI001BCBF659|nr:GGDEF domain-containing protein [Paraburkholderia sacchari]